MTLVWNSRSSASIRSGTQAHEPAVLGSPAALGELEGEVQEDRQVWPAPAGSEVARLAHLLDGKPAAIALVGERRAGEAVDDDVACRRRAPARSARAGARHARASIRCSSARGASGPSDGSKRSARMRSATGLPPGSRLTSAPMRVAEKRGLGGLADAFAAFDRDEPARRVPRLER